MKRLLVLVIATGMFLSMAVVANAGPNNQPPNVKVWMCHFAGHEIEPVELGSGTIIDGDYIINNVEGTPTQGQQDLCDGLGGKLINLSSRGAVNGHNADFQDRIAEYQ